MKKVYLAGAIFGLPDRGQDWREQAIARMPDGWEAINPNIVELDKVQAIDVIRGDYAALAECSAVIARVRNPSWGTAMEIQYAKNVLNIPVIGWPFLREPVLPHYSPWLLHHVRHYASDLPTAIGYLNAL